MLIEAKSNRLEGELLLNCCPINLFCLVPSFVGIFQFSFSLVVEFDVFKMNDVLNYDPLVRKDRDFFS